MQRCKLLRQLAGHTSNAKVMQNPKAEKKVASVAANYDGLLHE